MLQLAQSSDAHAVLAHCLARGCKHRINFPQGSVAAVCRWGGQINNCCFAS